MGPSVASMQDAVIRPSNKFIRLGYLCVVLLAVAGLIGFWLVPEDDQARWLLFAPVLLLIWPMQRQVRRQFTKATIAGDKLRYEVGALSRSTRNISLTKVQDVRVDQTVMQRMFGVGDISIETAGETSRLTLRNIDQPQAVADQILAASHGATERGPVA
jgi:uncharacterized membrane protein YdbT with pleckstrin-like domain